MKADAYQLVEVIRRYHLDDRSKAVRNFLRLLERGLATENVVRAFAFRIQNLVSEQERRPNLLHRAPDFAEVYGDGPPALIIGKCAEIEDVPVGLPMSGALHCVIGGTTGAGKTVAIRRLIVAVEESNRNRKQPLVMIILDRKGDYADLPALFGPQWAHYDANERLRLGLQNPLGVPPNIWINHLTTNFCARAGLIAGWATLGNMIRWAVAAMNETPGDQLLFPDFQLLLDLAQTLPKTAMAGKPQYLESLLQTLSAVTQGSGDLFRTFNGLDIERDLIGQGRSAVISMINLDPPWLSHFIAELIVSQVLLSRMQRGHRVDAPEVIFVLDECDEDVSRASEAAYPQGALSPIARTLRLGREFGIGVWLGLGALGPVSQQILNSATSHFLFRMGDADCSVAAARTLQIPRGADAIILSLEPGECLAKTPYWPHAVLCQVDFVPPCRNAQPRFEVNPHVPAKRLGEIPVLLAAANKLKAERLKASDRQASAKHAQLRSEARKLMFQASLHPYWPVARLYELIGVPTPRIQKAIRKELEEAKYARLKDVRVGSKVLCLIELLDPARDLLGAPPTPLRGRGSLDHKTFANWLRMVGQKRGHDASCECVIPGTNGHAADAAWRIGERWHAFEVIVTNRNLTSHLTSLLLTVGSPVERVTVVAPQKSMLKSLESQVRQCRDLASCKGSIEYVPISTFEKELWP